MIITDLISKIKNVSVTHEVIGKYLNLKNVQRGYIAKCPFCTDDNESFTVSPKLNAYKCFGCGKSGDAFSFLQEHVKMSTDQALNFLKTNYKID